MDQTNPHQIELKIFRRHLVGESKPGPSSGGAFREYILLDGFPYRRDRDLGDRSYWKCFDADRFKCCARFIRNNSTGLVQSVSQRNHSHSLPSSHASQLIRKSQLEEEIPSSSNPEIDNINMAFVSKGIANLELKVPIQDQLPKLVLQETSGVSGVPPDQTRRRLPSPDILGADVGVLTIVHEKKDDAVAGGKRGPKKGNGQMGKINMSAPAVEKYHSGDRVFAKLKGYPWWPAKIKERISGKVEAYRVYFYGTYDEATVKLDSIMDYGEEVVEKFTKKPPRQAKFAQAMEEIKRNMEILGKNQEPQLPPQAQEPVAEEDDMEEGALLIDEGPPVLTREDDKPTTATSSRGASVTAETKPKQPVRKASRGAKRESVSITQLAPAPLNEPATHTTESPDVEAHLPTTPASAAAVLAVPQPEIVSRSGRKIKPKRFADDFDTSTSAKPESTADAQPAAKRAKRSTTSQPNKAEAVTHSAQEKPQQPLASTSTRRSTANKQTPDTTNVLSEVRTPSASQHDTSAGVPLTRVATRRSRASGAGVGSQGATSKGGNQIKQLEQQSPPLDVMEQDGEEFAKDEGYVNGNDDYESGEMHEEYEDYDEEGEPAKEEVPDESLMQKIPIVANNGVELELLVEAKSEEDFPDMKAKTAYDTATAKNVAKIKSDLTKSDESANKFLETVANSVETKDDEMAEFVASKIRESTQNKIQQLVVEGEMIEIIGEIISNLNVRGADCDRAIELLERLSQQPLTTFMLKKHPEVVDTVRQLRNYYGNPTEWKFNDEQKTDFESKAEQIRKTSESTYQKFKSLFCSNSQRPFQVVYTEELQKFTNAVSGMSPKSVYKMVKDPSESPSPSAADTVPNIDGQTEGDTPTEEAAAVAVTTEAMDSSEQKEEDNNPPAAAEEAATEEVN